jgi:hypothetical protein
MADFNDAIAAAKVLSGGNVNIRLVDDANGISYPTFMWVQPKLTLNNLITGAAATTHPAFIVNGAEKENFEFSLYQNVVINDRALSLPFKDPKHTINFDSSRTMVKNNGAGYHIPTWAEWAAIALWCKKNGFQPHGNNNNGKDVDYPLEYGTFSTVGSARTLTGSGPVSWNHNNKPFGIADLNGNILEWLGGLRFVYGEVQVLADNNAADNNADQGADSTLWMAINAADSTLITPDGSGTTAGSCKFDYVSSAWKIRTTLSSKTDSNRSAPFQNTTCDTDISDAAALTLKVLGAVPADPEGYSGDVFYLNNGQAERVAYRGGNYGTGSAAGLFNSHGHNARSTTTSNLGFRSAFVSL